MTKRKDNQRGTVMFEVALMMLGLLVPLFFLQVEILRRMRAGLDDLQKERLSYDGERSASRETALD